MSISKQSELYCYSAYGLKIQSEILLPELMPASGEAEVQLRFEKLEDSFLHSELEDAFDFDRPGCVVRINKNKTYYNWDGIGKALIRDGREVIIEVNRDVEKTDLAPFITGSILGHLLNQRGFFVLHGSAVIIDGKGVAFLGDKGAGKSTLAAFLQARGHNLITDDLLPISFSGDGVYTIPGFPRIRLWEDSLESFGLKKSAFPKINRFIDKRSYQCPENFTSTPMKMDRIYILGESPEIEIKRLGFQESFIELLKNIYLNRYLQATGQTSENFANCKSIISKVPILKLNRLHDFNLLPDVAQAIEKEINN